MIHAMSCICKPRPASVPSVPKNEKGQLNDVAFEKFATDEIVLASTL